MLKIDTTELFQQLISDTWNDILFIVHSYLDRSALKDWSRHVVAKKKPAKRRRNIQLVILPEAPSKLETRSTRLCPKGCDPGHLMDLPARRCSDATWIMAQALLGVVIGCEATAQKLVTHLHFLGISSIDVAEVHGKSSQLEVCRVKVAPSGPDTTAKQYDEGHTLLIRWEDPGNNEYVRCASLMQEAWECLGHRIREIAIPIDLPDQSRPHYDNWLQEQVDAFIEDHGSSKHLLTVYLIGHGGRCAACQDHLCFSRRQSGGPQIDVSEVQAALREFCEADVLLVLDCCHAGHVPQRPDDPTHGDTGGRHQHIMETLAACKAGGVTNAEPPHDFASRLAGQLVLLSGEEGMTVSQLNSMLLRDWRNREFQTKSARHKRSAQNVRILNCGKESIVLRRLQ